MNNLTITDIAHLAGVSPATVSRVINKRPGVKNNIRKRVNEIIAEKGYVPSTLASGLSRGQTNIIGLILGDIRNPFYADLTYFAQKQLQNYGYNAMLFDSEYNSDKELECLIIANQLRFSGIIMTSALDSIDLIHTIDNLLCPVVLLNRTIENFNGSTVEMDNALAGYILTKHLIDLGHSSIAFLTGPKNSSSSSNRVLGFYKAMKEYRLPIIRDNIITGDLTQKTGYQVGLDIISNFHNYPSAIICGNDLMAIGLIDACLRNGIRVPEDISVAGFDDIKVSQLININLTTIKQPSSNMAIAAVDLILEKINDTECPNQHIVLEPELIVRGSTIQNNSK